jgi:Leucine-rich repeat (LRR) protein
LRHRIPEGPTDGQLVLLQDNQIDDISPLVGLTDPSALILSNNQITDIGPLVSN